MLNFLKQRFLVSFIFLITLLPTSSYPLDLVTAQKQPEQEVSVVDSKQLDQRALILKDYLARYDSPLENHAQDFVDAADKYSLDWKLVTAIAGVESTFGKQIPGGYNAWGWGVYGKQALGFKSWTDGIYEVSRGLKVGYVDKGLKDPLAMNRVYAASPVWGFKVNFFLQDLDTFSKKYDNKNSGVVPTILSKTAASSAQLALNSN